MVQVSVEMPEQLKRAIETAAREEGYTGLSEYVREATREKVNTGYIRQAAEELKHEDREDEKETMRVVDAIVNLWKERGMHMDSVTTSISYTDVLEKYEEMTGVEMSSAKFGHIRKRLGLPKKRRADGTYLEGEGMDEKIKELAEEYGQGGKPRGE